MYANQRDELVLCTTIFARCCGSGWCSENVTPPLCAGYGNKQTKKTIAITIIFPRPTHQLTRHICNANAAVSVSVCIRDVWTCVLYYFVCAAVCQHTCESPCVSLCVCVRQCEHIFEIKFITHLHTQTLDSRDVHVQLSRSSCSRRRRLSRQLLSVSEKNV